MAQKTRAQLASDIATQLASNSTKDITAADLRGVLLDMIDSDLNLDDDGVPGAQTLAMVLTEGDITGAHDINIADGQGINWRNGVLDYQARIISAALTADRVITIPDKDGTIAMLSDISGGNAPAGFSYNWTTGTSGDPGAGNIGVDSALTAGITELRISFTDANGTNQAGILGNYNSGVTGYFVLAWTGGGMVLHLDGPNAGFGSYIGMYVSYLNGSIPANGTAMRMIFLGELLPPGVGDMLAANNLSDLVDADTALDNLGLSADGKATVTAADFAGMRLLWSLVPGTHIASLVAGKIPIAQIPDSVIGQVEYQTVWSASANSPAIPVASSSNKGHFYIASTAVAAGHGYSNVPAVDFAVGDWIICDGTAWSKVDNTDQVTSVAGRIGAIVLALSDISDMSANARTFNSQANYSDMRNALGVRIGTDVQAFSSALTALASSSAYFLSLAGSADAAAAQSGLLILGHRTTTKSANFTVATGDRGRVFDVTTGASAITATLPTAATAGDGFMVTFRKADSGVGTMVTSPATLTLGVQGQVITVRSDGTSWSVAGVPWSAVSGTPTTVAGYGINDITSVVSADFLSKLNNLADLDDANVARANLSLGSTALQSGSANGHSMLTAANYAAMRALLQCGYSINVQGLTLSPADATTYYFGNAAKTPSTTAGNNKVYITRAGTIKAAEIYAFAGTAGTNENLSFYVRLNNTTDTLIQTVGAATQERRFSNTSLSIAVAVGDYIEIKFVCPTWATNPLTFTLGGYIYIE